MARSEGEIFDELAPLLGEYIEAAGWKALVIGTKGISHSGRAAQYYLIFEFTGGRMKEESTCQPSKKSEAG